jgi:hypothetical protein
MTLNKNKYTFLSMKIAILTSVSNEYFHLANELTESINRFPESKNIKICVLDGGLNIDQIKILTPKVYKIIKSYPLEKKYENLLRKDYENLFLPEYFPEFDKYIHIDADAWVNSWDAINFLIKGSDNGKIAVTSMGDRKIDKVTKINWIFGGIGALKSQNYKHAKKKGFSQNICRDIGLSPHINGGVFSLEKNSPFWGVWRKNFDKCIKKMPIYGSDQLALNISIYIDKCQADFLPHHCNWLPNPRNIIFDVKRNKFIDRFTPNYDIGIMHLAGGVIEPPLFKDIRFNNVLLDIETCEGKIIKKELRFKIKN